ncbi:type VI secretion system baseplate subunit TssF [Oleiagrimonas soli]|nr:type VI secretion system baseplate subunit TssF [Oleiagrimonas soli]KGI78276.1 hypothetical protein LF63_0108135 [Oleiagrimonas soli]
MKLETPRLKMWFENELSSLREEAVEFGASFPALARDLQLSGGRSSDPHVEMLMQSFAWLAGRLRYQLEADQAVLPNALLGILYPHLEAPLPAMLLGEIEVRADGANFVHGAALERGRLVSAMASSEDGKEVRCRFRTCFHTPLWPLKVMQVGPVAANAYALDPRDKRTASVVRATIRAFGKDTLQALKPPFLRFCIHAENKHAYRLHDALALHLVRMAVRIPGQDELRYIEPDRLRWCGFRDDEAMLDAHPLTHPGYRLVQEYFAFPQKFLFFEVDGLDLSGADKEFELLFLLDLPPMKVSMDASLLRLNCLPLVNLFPQRIEPFVLDQKQYEYRLIGDEQHHRFCEIYAIKDLVSIVPGKSPRPIAPYFSMDESISLERQDYFYAPRRGINQTGAIHGTETYLSFLDPDFALTHPAEEMIGGTALCTNRRLPSMLRAGTLLYLEGAGAVSTLTVACKPTPNQPPQMIGDRPWAVISQLCLNHLSLVDNGHGPEALKNMLRLHVGSASVDGYRQIDGLSGLQTRRVQRALPRWPTQRGFTDCLQIRLQIDLGHFEGASAALFASVLRHFLALYAEVNTVVEVILESIHHRGELKTWQPLTGAQANL